MQKKPFSAILHMSPRERMVTLVWTSCVLSGLLLVSVLFFVRPFPMFSQDSVAVLDATVADMNTQDKGRFVRIQVVPNPSDAGASSFIVPRLAPASSLARRSRSWWTLAGVSPSRKVMSGK